MIEGYEQLQRNLKKLGKAFDGPEGVEVVHKAARLGARIVRRKAPKGPTGNLKKAIKAGRFRRQDKGNPAAFVTVDRSSPGGDGRHAHLIEYGHLQVLGDWFPGVDPEKRKTPIPKGGKKGINRHGKQFKVLGRVKGRKFFRPGIAEAAPKMLNSMVVSTDKLLKKIKLETNGR